MDDDRTDQKQPFSWAFGRRNFQADPVVDALLEHRQSETLSRVFKAAFFSAYGQPANEEILKQGRSFKSRLKRSARVAVAALNELLVLAVFRCQMCNLTGVEIQGNGTTRPDFLMKTMDGTPFVVEVKTLFRGERLIEYPAKIDEFQELLLRQLKRRQIPVVSVDVLAAGSEIPSAPNDIRSWIKKAQSAALKARKKNYQFCSAKMASGATICMEFEAPECGAEDLLQREIQKIDEARKSTVHGYGHLRTKIVNNIDETQNYARRMASKIGGKLSQLENSKGDIPWVVAICIADPEMSLHRATAAVLPFLREKADDSTGEPRFSAALIVSLFDRNFDRLFANAPQEIQDKIKHFWSEQPVAGVDAVWIEVGGDSLQMNSLKTINLRKCESLWDSKTLPTAILSNRLIQDLSRHDKRLVDPKDQRARYLAITRDEVPIAGWTGAEKTLDQFSLCLDDRARAFGTAMPDDGPKIVKR